MNPSHNRFRLFSRTPWSLDRKQCAAILKRLSLASCILLLIVITVSQWWSVRWIFQGNWGFIRSGGIAFLHVPGSDKSFDYLLHRTQDGVPFCKWFYYSPGSASRSTSIFVVPLWIPFVLLLFASMWFHRQACCLPAGYCQKCSYDLTGNTSGVCPECGPKLVL